MAGGKSKKMLQRFIIKCLSDGEVWTNRQIYEESIDHYKGGMKGFASWQSCHSMIAQMGKFTNRRISPDMEVVKVGEGRTVTNTRSGVEYAFHRSEKYCEYILQER